MSKALKLSTLLKAATASVVGNIAGPANSGFKTFQASVTGTGAVTATLKIQVSNNPTLMGWLDLATITLSGTTTATDGFASEASWLFWRANLTAVTGTGASVDCQASEE